MILRGKTQRGKNVVKRDGDAWTVVRSSASVICLDGEPGFMIAPIDNPDKSRWVREKNDENFTW